MNLIPKICELLGVEIGEEFELCNGMDSCIRMGRIYKFANGCLMRADEDDKDCFSVASDKTLQYVLNGTLKIIKLPFEPKDGEKYWTVYWKGIVDMPCAVYETWRGDSCDFANKVSGNCFRTEAEAEAHKFEIFEKLTGKKWAE